MKIERSELLNKLQARYDRLNKQGHKATLSQDWDGVDDIAIRLFEIDNTIKLVRGFKNK